MFLQEPAVQAIVSTPEFEDFINSPSFQDLRNSSSYKNLLSSSTTSGLIKSTEFKSLYTSALLFYPPFDTKEATRFVGSSQLKNFIGSDELKNFLRSPEVGNLLRSGELNSVLEDQSTINLLRSPIILALGASLFQGVNINSVIDSGEWQSLLQSSEMQSLLNDPQIIANLGSLNFSREVNTEASFLQSFDWPRQYMQDEGTMFEPGQTKVELTDASGKAVIVSVFMPWEKHDNESSNLGVFSYLIRDADGVFVVDPGPLYDIYTLPSKQKGSTFQIPNQTNLLIAAIKKHFSDINRLRIKGIILTNWHPEHIEVAPILQIEAANQFGYKPTIRIHNKDKSKRNPPNEIFGLFFDQIGATAVFERAGFTNITWGADLANGSVLGNSGFTVIETPGYTNGSIALKNENLGYIIVDDWAINTARGGMSLESGCDYIQERGCEVDNPEALLSSMGGCSTMTGGCDMAGCDITSVTGCQLSNEENNLFDSFSDSTNNWYDDFFNFF